MTQKQNNTYVCKDCDFLDLKIRIDQLITVTKQMMG